MSFGRKWRDVFGDTGMIIFGEIDPNWAENGRIVANNGPITKLIILEDSPAPDASTVVSTTDDATPPPTTVSHKRIKDKRTTKTIRSCPPHRLPRSRHSFPLNQPKKRI